MNTMISLYHHHHRVLTNDVRIQLKYKRKNLYEKPHENMATKFRPIRKKKKTYFQDHKIYNKRGYYVDLGMKRNFLMLVIPEIKKFEKKKKKNVEVDENLLCYAIENVV